MDKEIFQQGRAPYYVEDVNSDKIIPKTIVVDFANKKGYVNTAENTKKPIAQEDIKMKIKNKLSRFNKRATLRGNTLKKLQEKLTVLQAWVDDVDNVTSAGSITTVYDLLKLFKDMAVEENTIKEQLKYKKNREEGKGLSEVNFNKLMENKLIGTANNANNYKHPSEKVCNFKSSMLSINGYIGDVVLKKEDVGLKDFNMDANNFAHTEQKMCKTESIVSINGKKGIVNLTPQDIGLEKLIDARVIEGDSFPNEFDGYITPKAMNNYLGKIKSNMSTFMNNKLGIKTINIKVYVGKVLESNTLLQTGQFLNNAKLELVYRDSKVSTNGTLNVSLSPGTYYLKVSCDKFFDNELPLIIDENVENGRTFNVYLDEYYEEYNLNIPDNAKYINVISTTGNNPIGGV